MQHDAPTVSEAKSSGITGGSDFPEYYPEDSDDTDAHADPYTDYIEDWGTAGETDYGPTDMDAEGYDHYDPVERFSECARQQKQSKTVIFIRAATRRVTRNTVHTAVSRLSGKTRPARENTMTENKFAKMRKEATVRRELTPGSAVHVSDTA